MGYADFILAVIALYKRVDVYMNADIASLESFYRFYNMADSLITSKTPDAVYAVLIQARGGITTSRRNQFKALYNLYFN